MFGMSLPGTIVLRPNEFSQPVKTLTGELSVGRMFRTTIAGNSAHLVLVGGVHQRKGRAAPHQGPASTLDKAKAEWRKCWDSADSVVVVVVYSSIGFCLCHGNGKRRGRLQNSERHSSVSEHAASHDGAM